MIRVNLEHQNAVKSLYTQSKHSKITTKEEIQKSKETPNRVAQIKEQIESGDYKVDLKKTSEKLALNLLGL